MKIVVDTREKHKRILEALQRMGAEIERDKLDCCDYEVCGSPYFLVERKNIRDLMNSTKSGRLWKQLRKIKEFEQQEEGKCRVALLIEDSPARVTGARRGRPGWNPMSVIGVMHSIQFDWGIPYIYAPSWWWSAMSIISLAKFTEESEKVRKVRLGTKPKDLNEATLYVAEGLPFVGPVFARKLLGKFGTVQGLANAPMNELLEVLDERKANFTWKIFRHHYEAPPEQKTLPQKKGKGRKRKSK